MGVMGVKGGTKTFSSATPDIIDRKTSAQVSSQEKAALGGQDLGDALNKITDPNWVDPSKKMRAVGNDKLDKDAFMKLMLAQMKNQDPTNPMQSHEMAAQLAQFSSVEQMQNVNSTLSEIKNAQKPAQSYQALNFIGKAVSGDSSQLVRSEGDVEHDFRFNLNKDAQDVQIKIRDANGELVRTYDLQRLKQGENKITWNGQDERGLKLRAGEYQFSVEAKDAEGKKVFAKTDFNGTITGVNYTSDGPVLMIGNQTIRLSDVKKIIDPSLMKNDQKITDVTSQDLKNTSATQQTNINNSANSTQSNTQQPVNSTVMQNVGLSREMLNKVAKETAPSSNSQVDNKTEKK